MQTWASRAVDRAVAAHTKYFGHPLGGRARVIDQRRHHPPVINAYIKMLEVRSRSSGRQSVGQMIQKRGNVNVAVDGLAWFRRQGDLLHLHPEKHAEAIVRRF